MPVKSPPGRVPGDVSISAPCTAGNDVAAVRRLLNGVSSVRSASAQGLLPFKLSAGLQLDDPEIGITVITGYIAVIAKGITGDNIASVLRQSD